MILSSSYGVAQDLSLVSNSTLLETPVTINVNNLALEETLQQITATSKVRFSYVTNDIPLQVKNSLHTKNIPLYEVLDYLLEGMDVKYFALTNQVVLKKVEKIGLPVIEEIDTLKHVKDSSLNTAAAREDTLGSKKTVVHVDYKTETQRKESRLFGKRSPNEYFYRQVDTVMWRTDSIEIQGRDTTEYKHKIIQTKRVVRHKYKHVRRRVIATERSWALGLYISSGYSFRTLTGRDSLVSQRNKDEKAKFAISGGALLTLKSKRWLTWRTGFSFLAFGEQGRFVRNIPNHPTIDISYRNSFYYASIPLMAGITLGRQKITTSFFAGIEAAVFLGFNTTFPENAYSRFDPNLDLPFVVKEDARNYTYNQLPLLLPVMIDLTYKFDSGVNLSVSPTFHYFLSSMYTNDEVIKSIPYYYGVMFGLSYSW